MRVFWVILATAPLLAACPCRWSQGSPFPPRVAFVVPQGHSIAKRLADQDGAIRESPRTAKYVADACSDAFSTLIGGAYCTARVKSCCEGVECRSGDLAAACTVQKQAELGLTCCADAAPAFFAKVTACAGMVVQGCALAATQDAPKAVP